MNTRKRLPIGIQTFSEIRNPEREFAYVDKTALAAQLIDADLGARIYYVSLDGFDTHAGQAATQGRVAQVVQGLLSPSVASRAVRSTAKTGAKFVSASTAAR